MEAHFPGNCWKVDGNRRRLTHRISGSASDSFPDALWTGTGLVWTGRNPKLDPVSFQGGSSPAQTYELGPVSFQGVRSLSGCNVLEHLRA